MKITHIGKAGLPRSFRSLRGYTLEKFIRDLISGLTVGMIALPMSMAFAISSGVPPQVGLYTSFIAGFTLSAFGGTQFQIGGPTGAFVVVIFGVIAHYGLQGLFLCSAMAGVFLMILGVTGLGSAVKFIPRPVIIGFTNGIAIIIASTQIKDFLGLHTGKVPGDFIGRMEVVFRAIPSYSSISLILGLSSLAVILLINHFFKRVPGMIVALVIATAAVWIFKLPIETIQSRFGGFPSGLPRFHPLPFKPSLMITLLSPALTITILGALESLLSAVVIDRRTNDKHDSNTELLALGLANLILPFFGAIPATGAVARATANVKTGAASSLSGIIHALSIGLILLFAAPIVAHIPLAVLAAILLIVCYNMGEWHTIRGILKLTPADISVWAVTFFLTVFADLSVAVEVGMVLAALLYISKVTATTSVSEITPGYIEEGKRHSLQLNPLPAGVRAFRIQGPFLFGSTTKLSLIEEQVDSLPAVTLLRLRNMTAIDATGLHSLERLADSLSARGKVLILCGMRDQPGQLMKQAEFDAHVGIENLCPTLEDAVKRANEYLATSP